jgi:hypothetical protein
MKFIVPALIALATSSACSKKAPLEKPFTGAPVAFEVEQLHAGNPGSLEVRAHNFSSETTVGYVVVMRFYDADHKIVNVGGADHDWTSFVGPSTKCAANADCSFSIRNEVPAGATSAEMLATQVTGTPDNVHVDDKPMFSINWSEWPSQPAKAS